MDIRIPEDYLPQINLRLNLYKRVSSVAHPDELGKVREEIRDRFGALPESVENLLRYGEIKFLAEKIRIRNIDRVGSRLVLKFDPSTLADLTALSRLLKTLRGALTPQGVMTIPLSGHTDPAVLDETATVLKELYGYTRIK